MTSRPTPDEYDPFYGTYVGLVPDVDVVAALEAQLDDTLGFLSSIAESDSLVRHEPSTWSTRQVVGHMTDAERIFGYRALRFARGDETPLAGFDEGEYARVADFDRTALKDLVGEFEVVRRANVFLFRNLGPEAWGRGGTANGSRVTVRGLAYIIVGHARHHTAILRKRFSV
jgi:hypothetical protein